VRRTLTALGIGLSLLSATVVTQPAQAASVLTVPLAPDVTAAEEVARFWLADGAANLRNATPYEVRTTLSALRLSKDIVPDGPQTTVDPLPGPAAPEGTTPTTFGKVFFIGDDLQPHWCTGTAVRSRYGNTVATAGHCMLDVQAPMGPLAKWVFVPGYSDGDAPFGLYVGKQGVVHYDFDDIHDHDRDVAFVAVYSGVTLSATGELTTTGLLNSTVGGQGITINQPLQPTVDVLGYPAGPHADGTRPHTGETLERSTGRTYLTKVTPLRMDRPIGVDSPFTGVGALGSPWLTGYADDTATGYLNGITISAADVNRDNRYDTGVSPYFDSEIFKVYLAAGNIWTGRIV
jgi:hypothetical protein